MSNFLKRLILTLVSVPVLIFSIFWPTKTHFIAIILFGFFVTFLGSYEFSRLLFKDRITIRCFFLPAINLFIYIFSYFYVNNFFNMRAFKPIFLLFVTVLIFSLSGIYARDILSKDFTLSLEKISNTVLGILYIGIPSFIIPLLFNFSPNPQNPVPVFFNIESNGTIAGSLLAFLFLIHIFSSDIFSYVFGMAFGRNNVINLEVSPKKSWAGYIGGYLTTFAWVVLYYIVFDRIFKLIENPLWFYLVLTAIGGIIVPMGDLVESVFKRSSNVKDSGKIIFGRGGILDSVDSMLFYAPIYFILLQLYYALI